MTIKALGRLLVFAPLFVSFCADGSGFWENGNSVITIDRLNFGLYFRDSMDFTSRYAGLLYSDNAIGIIAVPSVINCVWHEYVYDENGRVQTDSEGHWIYTSQTVSVPVGTIGSGAFRGCTSLTSVTIPNSVTRIESETFYGCTSLTSVTIPSTVTSIGFYAFRDCTSLTSVTIPNSVTSIENYAFYGCTSLTSVTIPNGVTRIESETFYGCTSLTSVTIPNSITSIGANAFYGCSSLAEVGIPASVTDIALNAFKSCDGLQRFVVDPANTVYASYDGALYTKDLKTLICYPGGRTDVKLPSSAVETKEDAFTGCGKLWAEWYRAFQKTRYDLTNGMEDRAIATITVNCDMALDGFVLKSGKVYDTVLRIVNTANHAVTLTLPSGYTYETFKGASPLAIPANSRNILTITRTADNVFLVSREELETVQ